MKRRVFAMVVAVITALAGAVSVISYGRSADQRALAGQEVVQALVAQGQVPRGTTAQQAKDQGLIVPKDLPRSAVPADALAAIDDSKAGFVATSAIQPGELILPGRFAPVGQTTGLLVIPPGMTAVTVPLEDFAHVGKFIGVGSHVVLMDTFNVNESVTNDVTPAGDRLQDRHEYRRATRVLLSDVAVLAVGETTTIETSAEEVAKADSTETGNSRASAVVTLVTLALTPEQATLVVHAARTGTLTAALLGPKTTFDATAQTDDLTMFGAKS